MGAYRFLTDCLTGRRIWRWFPRVGRPERPLFGPCTKAAVVGLPLAFGPPAVMWPPGYLVPGPGFAASGPGVTPLPPTPAAWLEGWGPYGGGEGPGPFGSPSPTAYSPGPPGSVEQPPPTVATMQPPPTVATMQPPPTVATMQPPPGVATMQPPPGVATSTTGEQQAVAEPASLLLLAVGAGAAVLAARGRA